MSKKLSPVEKKIEDRLRNVLDPEIGISIVDLGLVYDLKVEDEKLFLKMTLTTLGCPLFDVLEEDIRAKLKDVMEIRKVRIELVFDPPWSPELMTEEAKAKLGFL